jgi:hypothetical protein
MPNTDTIIMVPKHKKDQKHGVELILNIKRAQQNEEHRYSLRSER